MAAVAAQGSCRHGYRGLLKWNSQQIFFRRRESTAITKEFFTGECKQGDEIINPRNAASNTIFRMFQRHENEMSIPFLQTALTHHGIMWKTDPRLTSFRDEIGTLKEERRNSDANPDYCSREELSRLFVDPGCLSIISKALSRQCVIPDFELFKEKIKALYDSVKEDQSGKLADYIPQLELEDPERFGIALCTVDGQRIEIGDADVPFCMQSCMKPFQYAVAISNHTSDHVHSYVGKEPSGHLFNAITLNALDQPHNPMINAGALVICSLLKRELPLADRFVHIQNVVSDMAAKEYTSFHNAVFQSERVTAFRNFALAYLLMEKRCFPQGASVDETVDLYLQLCALKMTCLSASVASATLANGGVCPLIPDKRVLSSEAVRNTLSLMHSCGMYDYSGVFAFHVGLPAKSGVAGGLMLVVPNVMGVMIWSPLLDKRGNSVRGLRFCEQLVQAFNFHVYDNLRYSESKIDPRLSLIHI